MSIKINLNISNAQGQNYSDYTKMFGFWIYLMSDCILFSALFSVYFVLKNNIADGPSGKDIFNITLVLIETIFLLFSSMTYGMSIISMNENNKQKLKYWLYFTFFLGLSFVFIEIYEFRNLINEGYGPSRSAFLSSFFLLIATHGFHVVSGLIWMMVIIVQILIRGLTLINKINLYCLGLFWHFLDIVWICVFTTVYLIGILYK